MLWAAVHFSCRDETFVLNRMPATKNQCCGSASFWCRSGSGSDFPFWCPSRSGSGSSYPKLFSCWKICSSLHCLIFLVSVNILHWLQKSRSGKMMPFRPDPDPHSTTLTIKSSQQSSPVGACVVDPHRFYAAFFVIADPDPSRFKVLIEKIGKIYN